MNRRMFIKGATATAVGTVAFPTIVPASVFGKHAPSNKIQIGQIGCGRIARDHDMAETIKFEQAQFVAVCDVDSRRLL
ncbi:MAG: gfo/Idh/MocA family oxidoreductase, partial [Proteiniphilum sp.]|nr:gfo/Idh/MocA family oxidoreductase [Proteiniphilum sp.]